MCSAAEVSDRTCVRTSPLVKPATASFAVSTGCPVTRARSAPTSCGYGVQSQAVPYGTESPSAEVAAIPCSVPAPPPGVLDVDRAEVITVAGLSLEDGV